MQGETSIGKKLRNRIKKPKKPSKGLEGDCVLLLSEGKVLCMRENIFHDCDYVKNKIFFMDKDISCVPARLSDHVYRSDNHDDEEFYAKSLIYRDPVCYTERMCLGRIPMFDINKKDSTRNVIREWLNEEFSHKFMSTIAIIPTSGWNNCVTDVKFWNVTGQFGNNILSFAGRGSVRVLFLVLERMRLLKRVIARRAEICSIAPNDCCLECQNPDGCGPYMYEQSRLLVAYLLLRSAMGVSYPYAVLEKDGVDPLPRSDPGYFVTVVGDALSTVSRYVDKYADRMIAFVQAVSLNKIVIQVLKFVGRCLTYSHVDQLSIDMMRLVLEKDYTVLHLCKDSDQITITDVKDYLTLK